MSSTYVSPGQSNPISRTKLASAVSSFFERLERRELLAAQVWVNDNWVLRTDIGPEGLSIGDVVENTGAGDAGPVVTGIWGTDAFDAIADAVNVVDAGGTVNVLAGQYQENLDVNKAVKIVGRSPATTVLRSAGAADSIVLVRHSGVSITRLTLGGSLDGGPEGGGPTVGIDIDGGSTAINNITISGNDIGVRVRNGGSILSMTENFVTNNAIAALEVQSTAGSVSAVFNNDLSGPGMAVMNAAASVVNASGNYFGADTTQAGVAARNTAASVDFTPWLSSGTDTSANPGFQGQFTDLNVGAAGQQSGSTGRIREGVTLVASGSNVFVHPGTYGESDINVNKAVTIDGVGSPASVIVAPAVADAHATAPGSTFAPGTHNAFVVRSGDVTVKDLTIDGDAGVGGAGSMNFFGGIVYDYTLGSAFNNLQAKNLTVKNAWRVGIYFDGGLNALSTGHTVMDNAVDNVSGGTGASGILMLQASGTVTGNTITDVDGDGIVTNYIDGVAFAPTIAIRDNTISGTQTGMNLSGLAAGSAVGGAGASDGNTITMAGGGDDAGIVVQYAAGAVTVEGNTISGDGDDSGIWLYHNNSTAAPVVRGNTLTATASTSTSDGDGTGIFVTDDGSFFTETSGGDSYATISGNIISGFFRGIDLYRNEDNPAGGFTVNATIDANNKVSGGNTGVRVFDSNGTAAADAVANINGNSASIHGNAIGIDVAGGTATVTNNHVYDNGVAVAVRDGGVATINNNGFDGGASDDNDTDVLVDSTAPAGITGGAMSGNTFAGSNFFIDNESAQHINALATAGNTFAAANNFRIEDRVHHAGDTDRALAGKVTWVANNWYVTDPAVGVGSTDSSIQFAINQATAGDTVNVESGTFTETVTVSKTLTLRGAQAGVDARGRGGPETVLTTDLVDETLAIVHVTAADAVLDGFTIEGDGPAAGGVLLLNGTTNSNAARGVVVDAGNVQVINNRVNNTYRRGVQFWVDAATAPVGGLVNQNEFNVIGADVASPANSGDAVLAFSDPTVTNNDVNTARTGVTFIQVYAPSVTPITISGNDINAVNGIALNETSSGIPTITITGNTVSSGNNGIGLQLWTVDGNLVISGNTFTGTGAGDRGVYAWDGTANDPMNVTISGGSFTGYQTGVHLTNEEGVGPFGPALANATLTLSAVTVSAGSTGVFVEDTAAGTMEARVNITNDANISTGGTGTGVRVSGAAARARVVDNDDSITNNLRGVDVDGGTALLQNNDLGGNTIGVLVRNGGVADLGQSGAGTNFTGLGISTGGNDFSAYTAAASATAGAIVNLNAVPAAGRQGLPGDVPAFNNLWSVSTAVGIENVVHHDVDNSALGFVDYRAFANLAVSLTSAAVNEGGTTTVNGSFTDVAMPHTVTIVWGDGSPDTVVNLAAGVESFAIASPAGTTYGDDPDGPTNSANHALSVTVKEDATTATLTDNSLGVTVSNVAPTIPVTGSASVNEGSSYTLNLGTVVDPGDDTVTRYIINWGDGDFLDVTGNPNNATHAHTYDDGTQARNVTVSLFDEDAAPHPNAGTPDPFTVTVNNVAPTGNLFNGGPVPEGSAGLVGFGAQFDPSSADTAAGFRYSYDFNNDGDFTDALEHSDITNAAVGVPFVYLNDGPGSRTVRARIKDKDGGFTDYTTTITIFNVTPFVNAGPDVNAPANIAWSQQGTFSDPGADAPWMGTVDYDWHPGDNDAVPLPLSGFNFTLNHSYASPGTYTVRVFVKDKDNATGFDDLTVNVGPTPTFQVNQFLFNTSGFTLRFNRALDTSGLNLYDGLMGTTPSSEAPDLTLVGNSTGPVRGSLVWDPATNIATFVRTGGALPDDTYTLTVRSANNAFKDTLGGLLDGNADGTAGDDYVQTFNASNVFQRTLSVPDFARGPDAGNNVNVPNTGTLGIPVRIDDGAQVRSVDFRIHYNPALLDITGAQLAAGMPGDWSITSNLSTPGTAIITVFGTTTDLPSGPQNIVKLIANVPNNAPYQSAGALRFTNMVVSRNDATTLSTRGDSGMHKVMYFGDADGDRAYTGFDAGLLSRVVVNLDSGFHAAPLADPVIVADIDGSGSLSGIDASFVAQKAAGLARPEIPNLPGVLPPLIPGGVDPLFSTPDNKPGRPGGTVTMPIGIDDASGTLGYNLTIDYDTSLLDLANANVQLGALYQTAGGWSLVANVDDATGHATLVFWRTNGVPMPPGSGGGEVATATFGVAGTAAHNAMSPIDLDGNPGGSGLTFTFDDGSVLVDAVAPSVITSNYKYQTAPHKLEFEFSEDVFASLAAGDFVVVNNTTSTTIPATDFALTYNATTNVATLSYVPTNGVLPDGNYTVTITAANVTDAAGNPLPGNHALNFFFLMADANHDGRVNLNDFNILAANFGQSPRDFTQADFNYDTIVNLNDFNILAARFGQQLGPDGTLAPPTGNPPALPPNFGGEAGAVTGATDGASAAGMPSTTMPPTTGSTTTGTATTTTGSATTNTRRTASRTTTTRTSTTTTGTSTTSPFSTVSVGAASSPATAVQTRATTSAYTSPVFANKPIARGSRVARLVV